MADVTNEINDLKARLDNSKKASNQDLYKHVVKTLSHLVKHCPHDTLNKFEEVSYLIKHSDKLDHKDYLLSEITKNYAKPSDEATKETTSTIINNTKGLFPPKPVIKGPPVEGDAPPDEAPVEEPMAAIGLMPDLFADAKVWEWGGVGFGEYELMLLHKSLKKLIKKDNAPSMRLWGKIKGTEKDYYIAEGTLDPPAEPVEGEEAPEEPRGTGINKFVYWVTNSSTTEWTQLPDLKPQDVTNARNIKIYFSGNLDKQIYTNPFFFGPEKVYLRAQIARISHSTSLAPQGNFRTNEENPREIEDNAPEDGPMKVKTVKEMCNMEKWVHHQPGILLQARTTHRDGKPLEGEEEVEPEELLRREVAKDPLHPRLKPVTQDEKTLGGMPAWILRSYNCTDQFIDERTGKSTANFGIVVLKSLWWPGAFSFYQGERLLSIYCGNGQKHEAESYYPVCPPTMMAEREEKVCYGEPNPTEDWLKKRAAWEAAQKSGEQPAE